jgi:predicted GNAT superfamily acetyltransferase
MKIENKIITDIKDYKEIVNIQKSAWGFSELDIEPHQLITRIQKYGGLVTGLFIDGKMIGFSFAFLAKEGEKLFLYSHMAAVKKEYQGQGFGFIIKKFQREETLKMGYKIIKWTYDPLESLNSYFNIHRLGAVSNEYEENIYGIGESGLHRGLPTDRMVACWVLDSERVKQRVNHKFPIKTIEPDKVDFDLKEKVSYIEIPKNIRDIKKKDIKEALFWRLKTRELFERSFEKMYIVDDIVLSTNNKRIFYRLVKDG